MDTNTHHFSKLTPDFVMDAVESLGFPCDARLLALNSYENRVFQIGLDEAEPIIGKFYRPQRWSNEQILEEHAFTMELADMEIPVVPPMILPDGSTLAEFQDFRFSLYERKGGRAPNFDDVNCLEVIGRFIGRIHSIGSRQQFVHRPSLTVSSFAEESQSYLLGNNFIPVELIPAYQSITDELLVKLRHVFDRCKDVPQLRLHGDCHVGNVLWRDEIPHFVDFDDARNGPAIQDLWMMLSGPHEMQSLQIRKILAGYTDFCDFDPIELLLVEPLRTLRIMHHCYWLASRWDDPAFPRAFPWFEGPRFWSDHVLELREQLSALDELPLQIY